MALANSGSQVNFYSGNVMVALPNVSGGTFDTIPGFVYNSLTATPSSNGYGVAGLYSRTVKVFNSTTATVEMSSGSRWAFTSRNASGEYLPLLARRAR